MTVVRVPSIGRSIPTPIQYQVERIESTAYEFDASSMNQPAIVACIQEFRDLQVEELDRLDDRVREAYGMKPRTYAYNRPATPPTSPPPSAVPSPPPASVEGPRTTALGVHGEARASPTSSPAGTPIHGPATAMAPTAETLAELRRLAAELGKRTGEPVEIPRPKTEAEAIRLVRQLEADLAHESPKPPVAPKHPPASWTPGDERLLLLPGDQVPAGKRACCNQAAHGKTVMPLSAKVWDYCLAHDSLPLCLACQDTTRGRA